MAGIENCFIFDVGFKINKMEELIVEFKKQWSNEYRHIDLVLNDKEIAWYINKYPTISLACDIASDYILSQDLSEVQE